MTTPDAFNSEQDYLLRDAIFDRVGDVYTESVLDIVRDWLGTYERAGCSLGDAQAELDSM